MRCAESDSWCNRLAEFQIERYWYYRGTALCLQQRCRQRRTWRRAAKAPEAASASRSSLSTSLQVSSLEQLAR